MKDLCKHESRALITISIPVFNEEENVELLVQRLNSFSESEQQYNFEYLFTDNASSDRTFELLAQLAHANSGIRVLRFSRNFGFQKSILTNFLNARGAAAVQIDADLQDPPELISEFLREWEAGYKVVFGIRRKRKESLAMHALRKLYYRTLSTLSETYVPPDAGDFRLIDREIIEQLREVREQTPYLRGLIASMGFPQKGIPYDREHRARGLSKFNWFHLISLGLDGITSQSTRPLKLITFFGFALSFLTFVASLFYFLAYYLSTSEWPSGFTTLVILVLVSIGLNSLFLGLIGEYIGRIFNNTRGLPMTIVENRIEPKPSMSVESKSSD